MYTYIKQSVSKHFATFELPLSAEEYNNIGENWEDYLDNKWVLLTAEQVAFRENNPTASVNEVWNLVLYPPYTRTLLDAKEEKIRYIKNYDNSENVNSFNIEHNGEIIATYWLTPAERANYKSSIDAAELVGLTELSLYIGEIPVTLPVQTAKLMLAQIQLYADQCFIVTKLHIVAVNELLSIEDVDSFEYNNGYPQKLTFTI